MNPKKKIRIAVLTSGDGSNLDELIRSANGGILRHGEIVYVVATRKNSFALNRAGIAGISKKLIDRTSYPSRGAFEGDILASLAECHAELLVLTDFYDILSPGFLKAFPGPIINLCPALLPAFAGKGMYGLRIEETALARGVKVAGATVHLVNDEVGGGEILLQKSIAVRKDDTPETLMHRIERFVEWQILPRATEDFCKKMLSGK